MGVEHALVVSSLPTSQLEDTRVACPTCGVKTLSKTCTNGHKVPQPKWRMPPDSDVRETCAKMTALQLAGMTDQEIADYLGLGLQTIRSYRYLAGKNGWMEFNTPREAIEFGLMPKVIRNLNAALDDRYRNETTGLTVGTTVALKIAEGVTFKEFGQADGTGAALPQTAISIRIEQPANPMPLRAGTIGGQAPIIEVEPCQTASTTEE